MCQNSYIANFRGAVGPSIELFLKFLFEICAQREFLYTYDHLFQPTIPVLNIWILADVLIIMIRSVCLLYIESKNTYFNVKAKLGNCVFVCNNNVKVKLGNLFVCL